MTGTREAESIRDAIVGRDFKALARALAPEATMRALLPAGPREYASPVEIVQAFERWFGAVRDFSVKAGPAERVGSRVRVGWIVELSRAAESPRLIITQDLIVDAEGGLVKRIDLLCSGFESVPAQEAEARVEVEFDAGDRGCADGLAGEFRRRISALRPGDVLRVGTRDPAAREDLPPLARLLGHRVLEVEAQENGSTWIRVERGTK